MIKVIVILLIVGLIWFFKSTKSGKSSSATRASGATTWRNDDILIRFKTTPPHFRNIQARDAVDELSSCGFCKHFEHGCGCKKYGVEYSGVGSVVKTICDDFESSLS